MKLKSQAFSLILLLTGIPGRAELSKTHPNSPITTIRLSAYLDSFGTIYESTNAFKTDEWGVLGGTRTFVPNTEMIEIFWSVKVGTVPDVVSRILPLETYTDLVYQEGRFRAFNDALEDVEIYMVYPSTTCPPGWRGWASEVVNGKIIPKNCQ